MLHEFYPEDMLRCIIPHDYVSDSARCWDMLCIFAEILDRELFREDAKALRGMAWLIFKRCARGLQHYRNVSSGRTGLPYQCRTVPVARQVAVYRQGRGSHQATPPWLGPVMERVQAPSLHRRCIVAPSLHRQALLKSDSGRDGKCARIAL